MQKAVNRPTQAKSSKTTLTEVSSVSLSSKAAVSLEKGDDFVEVPPGISTKNPEKVARESCQDLGKEPSGKTWLDYEQASITPSTASMKSTLHEVLALRSAGKGRKGKAKGRGLAPLKTWLVWGTNSTSAAATAGNPVFGITPANAISWNQWAMIYDEVMVEKFEVRYWYQYGGVNPADVWAVMSYDPIDLTALSGISAGSEYSQHKLFGLDFITAPDATVPRITNSTGLLEFRGKCPSGTQRSSATATSAAGQWMDTADGADAWGYLKLYTEAMGAATTVIVRLQIRAFCHFRSRAL